MLQSQHKTLADLPGSSGVRCGSPPGRSDLAKWFSWADGNSHKLVHTHTHKFKGE